MNAPTVSVIVPNYNHARFLRQRLDSILHQTWQDFEILFLDDASTDDSREVFQSYAGQVRIRSFFNEQNSGSTFRQWNRAVRDARGEYLWFAESDDYADPDLLSELVRRLEENPGCGLAYCQSIEVDENGQPGRNFIEYTADLDADRWKSDFTNRGTDELARYLFVKNTLPNASAVLIRRSAWDAIGSADENMRLCGDWLLWARILAKFDIAFVARPLNYFRHHHQSVRANRMRTLLFVWERYEVMDFILKHTPVDPSLRHRMSDLLADLWRTYAAEDLDSRRWHARIYRVARRVDPRLHGRMFDKTLRPWLGSVKNRLKARLLRS